MAVVPGVGVGAVGTKVEVTADRKSEAEGADAAKSARRTGNTVKDNEGTNNNGNTEAGAE